MTPTLPSITERALRSWAGFAGITLAIVLTTATVGFMFYREQVFRQQQVEQITVQAQILAGTVSAPLAFDDRKTAQEFVDRLAAIPSLQAAAVYDIQHRRMVSFTRAGGEALPMVTDPTSTRVVDSTVIVTVPVIQGATELGFVALKATLEGADRRFARLSIMAALVLLAILAVTALVTGQASLRRVNHQLSHANRKLQDEIAERTKAEEALRQSQKMEAIGQLAGGIAHDFNNLLGVVKGNMQLLRRRVTQGRTDIDRYVQATEEAVARAANLTQRILAYSRRQPLTPTNVRLSDLVAGMTELIKHSIKENVELDMRLDADWTVLCDVNQMENVVLNLTNNAGDAMPDGGRLTVATKNRTLNTGDAVAGLKSGDYVELTVTDTGMGMDEDTAKRSMDPFFTTKPVGQGTGLGLSTSVGYVRQSAGQMIIETAVGKGTTVRILMPRYGD